jgi:hypothetical protein
MEKFPKKIFGRQAVGRRQWADRRKSAFKFEN